MPSFRLPALPSSSTESPAEIADFWEILTIRRAGKSVALASVRAAIDRSAESDPAEDAEEDIEEEGRFDDAIEEIKYRMSVCGKSYPFYFATNSYRVIALHPEAACEKRDLYLFLLLATRLNMNTRRTFVGIDGPLLFEEVCEAALREMCGVRGQTHRFGTSAGAQNFSDRLTSFFSDLQEFGLRDDRPIPNHGGDDGVDLAWWNTFSWNSDIPFQADCSRPPGKLIVLAQCKTGTSWDAADMNRLSPSSFFQKWMVHDPLGQCARLFMTAARVDDSLWEDVHRDGGVFFDRCRIVDYAAPTISSELMARVRRWTAAATGCSDLGDR
jgi:hypothetical protein